MKLFFIFVTFLLSLNASAEQVLAKRTNVPFALLRGEESIGCSLYDLDKDGIKDKAIISLNLGSEVQKGVGILQNTYIQNEVTGSQVKEICQTIKDIEDSLPNSFGALTGTYSSALLLTEEKLIETISVIVYGSAMDEAKTVTFTEVVVQPLQ